MTDETDFTEVIEKSYESAAEILARDGIYGEIKRALIIRGIPVEEIAFIHDYSTPAKKAKVFADVNAGRVRVLIGSTEKMGIGANFQQRLVALHHLTPTFRSSDISQREGRILRQGNIFPEVHICTYVTESSFDAFMWGLIETKARFISQIMAGEVTARTAEDVDQLVMTAAQIKAIASGNPQIVEKVATEVELTKLERLYSVWSAGRARMRRQLETMPSLLDSTAREIAGHQQAIATRDQNSGDDFVIDLKKDVSSEEEDIVFSDRGRAGAHLRQLCFGILREARIAGRISKAIGSYRGFEIVVRASGRHVDALSSLFSEVDTFLRVGEGGAAYSFNLGDSDVGIIQSMDAQLRGIDGKLEKALASQRELEHRRHLITAELSKGWEPAGRYQELKQRLNVLNQSLAQSGGEIEPSPELSSLDEDAFQPVPAMIGVHQLLTLADESRSADPVEVGIAEKIVLASSEPTEDHVRQVECSIESPQPAAADIDLLDQSDLKFEIEAKEQNTASEFQLSSSRLTSRRSKAAEAAGQMSFAWQ